MTKAGFGEHLKRERELRAVSLEEICGATRIGTRFLEALENEEWERLPGGVFNRGFVRAVARYLGLDEEGMVAEYGLAVSEQQSATPAWMNPPAPAKQAKRWLPWLGFAAVVVLAGAGWLAWRHYSLRRSQHAAEPSASGAQSPEGALAAGLANATPPSSPVDDPVPMPAFTWPPADPDLKLEVEAGKTATVTLSIDGRPPFTDVIAAGQKRTFAAEAGFEFYADDSGALLLELNGHTLPPLGPPGQPGQATLTRRDLPAAGGGTD